MSTTHTVVFLRCGTRSHEVCVVYSLDDAQTQDGPLINTKLYNLYDCVDNSMSQVKDTGALETGAEGLEEVVSVWDAPYQQLEDEDDGDTSPVVTAVCHPVLVSIGSAGANMVRPLTSTAPLKALKVSTRGNKCHRCRPNNITLCTTSRSGPPARSQRNRSTVLLCLIAQLLLTTNSLMCSKHVSQKRNEDIEFTHGKKRCSTLCCNSRTF